MHQYDVHRNIGRSRRQFPFFVVVQSGLLNKWDRRLACPFGDAAGFIVYPAMFPVFNIVGHSLHFLPHLISAIPMNVLGEVVTNLSDDAEKLINAIDLVLSRGHST